MQGILIVDCDTIVNIFDILRRSSRRDFIQAVEHLNARYSQIWIPKEVIQEFTCYPMRTRRKKLLNRICDQFQFIIPCPITVSQNEINIDNNFSSENKGETDAMLQASKAMTGAIADLKFSSIHLFFRDKEAIRRAEQKNLSVKLYKEFKEQMLEVGIIIP